MFKPNQPGGLILTVLTTIIILDILYLEQEGGDFLCLVNLPKIQKMLY